MLLNHISKYGVLPAGGLITPTPTLTINASPTPTRTITPTISISPSLTRTASVTPTPTITPTFTLTPTMTKLAYAAADESRNYNTPTPSPVGLGGDSPFYYSQWQMPVYTLNSTYMDSDPKSGGLGFGPWRILRYDNGLGQAYRDISQQPGKFQLRMPRQSVNPDVVEIYREITKPVAPTGVLNPYYVSFSITDFSADALFQGQEAGVKFYNKDFSYLGKVSLFYFGPFEPRAKLILDGNQFYSYPVSRTLNANIKLTSSSLFFQEIGGGSLNAVTGINGYAAKYFSMFCSGGSSGGTGIILALSNLQCNLNVNASF